MTQLSVTERLLRRDRHLLVLMICALFLLAGLYTVFGVGMDMSALEMTAMRDMRDMPGVRAPGDWSASHALLVFLMWWVMMIAMMLPSVAPTVLLNAAMLRHTEDADRVAELCSVFLAGYLVAWAGFSLVAASVQWALEAAGVVSATMMTLIDTVPGGLLLIVTGVFQFSSLKAACLAHCRAPIKFLTERRKPGVRGAFLMGLEHGTYCLACCWFLMALLFVGGIMNLIWIVGLAAFVALERLSPWGETAPRVAGVVLILWGVVILGGLI